MAAGNKRRRKCERKIKTIAITEKNEERRKRTFVFCSRCPCPCSCRCLSITTRNQKLSLSAFSLSFNSASNCSLSSSSLSFCSLSLCSFSLSFAFSLVDLALLKLRSLFSSLSLSLSFASGLFGIRSSLISITACDCVSSASSNAPEQKTLVRKRQPRCYSRIHEINGHARMRSYGDTSQNGKCHETRSDNTSTSRAHDRQLQRQHENSTGY